METRTRERLFLAGTLALGAVFVASAVAKAVDAGAFEVLLVQQGVAPTRAVAAWLTRGLLALELALGLACWQPLWRRRLVLPAIVVLLAGFSVYLVYLGWIKGETGNCGCFGELLRMSPKASLVKNAALVALAAWLWRAAPPDPRRYGWALLAGAAAVAAGVGLALPVRPPVSPAPRFARPDFPVDRGRVLLAFLSLDCEHCRAAATAIGEWRRERVAAAPAEPPASFFVFLGAAEDAPAFLRETGTAAVRHMMGDPRDFFAAIADQPPSVYVLHDGQVLARWDGEAFTPAALAAAWR